MIPFSLHRRVYANVILDEKDSFQVNHVYQDKDTYAVVAAASEILGKTEFCWLEVDCSKTNHFISCVWLSSDMIVSNLFTISQVSHVLTLYYTLFQSLIRSTLCVSSTNYLFWS